MTLRATLLPTTLAAVALPFALAAASFLPANAAAELAAGQDRTFVEKRYEIRGDWSVIVEDGRTIIRFSDDFKTKGGPDLKVFLSPTAIDSVNGDNATDGSVLLGTLASTKGGQDYVLPDGVNLEDFESVLVHCEQFSVLWGGGAL